MWRAGMVAAAVVFSACGVPPWGTGSGGDLSCDVAVTLNDSCWSCHGATPTQSAPFSLVRRADFTASFDGVSSNGVRSLVRMKQAAAPMPPAPAAHVSVERIAAFEQWVNDGMPAGTCEGLVMNVADAGTTPVYDGGVAGLPCEVAAMVASRCAGCHRTPPVGGTSFALLSRDDFLVASTGDPTKNRAQQSVVRMNAPANPMPPVGYPAPAAAELAAFTAWVNASVPAGDCGSLMPDAGPAPTTCASNSMWTLGDQESPNMNPGLACKACHARDAPFKNYPFMGTVYPSAHEKDRCFARPPAGTRIEIIDRNGAVAVTMTPSTASGNFRSASSAPVQLPYTARVIANGKTVSMTTPQTDGDCNTCHTEQGTNGATGRIFWP